MTKSKTKPNKAKTTSLKTSVVIIEKPVQSAKYNLFQKFLKLLVPKSRQEKRLVRSVVEAAIIAEFSPAIKQRLFYQHMLSVITSIIMRIIPLKKTALKVARKHSK